MPQRPCFAESDEPYQTGHWSPVRAWITPQWKYIRSPKAELYDLLPIPRGAAQPGAPAATSARLEAPRRIGKGDAQASGRKRSHVGA